MKYEITVCHKNSPEQPWKERYEEDIEDPQVWAEEMVNRFNSTLRPGEKERTLLNVEVIDNHSIKNHTWKKENLVTISKAGQYYDIVKCSGCGITAKRYGVDRIVFDSEFGSAKVYQRCDTSLAHLKKKRLLRMDE